MCSSDLTVTDTFVLTVTNTNDVPTVSSAIADASTDEDATYSLDVSGNFADVDATDTLSYAATGMPSTLSMSTSGTISGTPVNADVGAHTIIVTVTDSSSAAATASDTFVLTVVNTDDATQGASALVGDGSPWTQTTSDTLTNYGSSSSTYTLTITSFQRATITMTNTDNYASECGLEIDGTDVGCGYASSYQYGGQTGSPYSITTAGTYAVVVTDSYGDGGNYATIIIEDGTIATTYVTITGDSYDDATLTADTSLLTDDDGMGTFAYQWATQTADISGATSSTYTIPSCESSATCSVLGNTYTVNVTHTDAYSVSQIMPTSAATSVVTLNPNGDLDGDGTINSLDTDDDGDGWIDTSDAFPTDSDEWLDTDGDGIGNNEDTDDDGDGTADVDDDFPLDSTEQWDADGDGWGHNADSDDDGDGIEDTVDDDDDGDGVDDVNDAFPNNYNEWYDTDGDGIGNNADTDDDGDGVDDVNDAFPLDSTETLDTDGDGIGNNADTDDDGDGYSDDDETTNCGEGNDPRSEEHTSELQSQAYLVCRLQLEKKKHTITST